MFKLSFILVLTTCALAAFADDDSDNYPADSDSNLLNFLTRSNVLLQQNPSRSLECFNYYIPLINQLAEQYEANYKGCLSTADNDRNSADEATLEQRNELANNVENSCSALGQCGQIESASDVLECYISGGSSSINIMYSVNANASEALANLKEQYYLIQSKENRCTTDVKRVYEKDSTDAYDNLNNCIQGKSEVPTTVTTVEPTTEGRTTTPTEVESTTPVNTETTPI